VRRPTARHHRMAGQMLLLCGSWLLAAPLTTSAQFIERGNEVEVVKGTRLCANFAMEQAKGTLEPARIFWKVTSQRRSNGTQTVSAFVREQVYDRFSGDTKTTEARYDEDYAVLFRRDPAHKGMVLLISPKDGRVEATVEVCGKRR
jgi:hypothetical protein